MINMEDKKNIILEFINGGWIILVVGAAGMAARIIYSGAKHSIIDIVKKMFAAMLCSGIAWFVLEQTEISSLTKAISYGVVGVVSPEIVNGLIKIAARFAKNPIKFFNDNRSN
jgi:hypothetical protein